MSRKKKHGWDEDENYPEYFLYYNPWACRQYNYSYENGGVGVRWIYVLLLLIVIVLQFGRRQNIDINKKYRECEYGCCPQSCGVGFNPENTRDDQLIDNNILFIVVAFLLVLCNGCWFGGYSQR